MKSLITIGREVGSGGFEIGKRLADKLGLAFYDEEIITRASQESGIAPEFFKNADEKNTDLFSKFCGNFANSILNPTTNSILDSNSLFPDFVTNF